MVLCRLFLTVSAIVSESLSRWKVESLYLRLCDFSLSSSCRSFPRTMLRLIIEIEYRAINWTFIANQVKI
jgi:hypothetical protein